MESLDEYKPAVLGKGASKVHIMPIPNRMESLAVRPIVLDVAGDEIVYPTLTHRSHGRRAALLETSFHGRSEPRGGSSLFEHRGEC